MKKIIFLTILFVTYVTHSQTSKDKAIIDKVIRKYSEAASVRFDIDYKIKYFDHADTTKISGSCKMVRNAADTIFKSNIWITSNIDGTLYHKYYTPKNFHVWEAFKDTIKKFNPSMGEIWAITGSTDGDFTNMYFVDPEKINRAIADKSNKVSTSHIQFKNSDYLLMTVDFPDHDEITNSWKKLYINTKTLEIDKITFYAQLLDQNQYNEWNLSNIKFNSVTNKELEESFKNLSAGKQIVQYEPPSEEELMPLPGGMPAPDFSARLFTDNKTVNLSDYKGKIVLIDYWYMSCYYCVKSIPALTHLQEKYKDQIVVLGVNPYDESDKQKEKLPAFIKRNNPGYQLAFIDADVVDNYKVHGFPTLYIIDKNGVIQESHVGYSDNYEEHLDGVIAKMIAQ